MAKTTKTAPKASPAAKTAPTEIRWTDKRKAIVKAMLALKATSASAARTAEEIAAKAGLEPHEVKHYGYKDEALAKLGYLSHSTIEGVRVLNYYLTPKGAKASMA